MNKKLSLGTISHATLNPRDLLPAFLFALEEIDQKLATRFNSELIELGFGSSQCGVCFGPEEEWPIPSNSDEILEIIEDIENELGNLAPDYCYFGANEGDGSDFGFWPCMDQIREDMESGDLPSFQDVDDDYSGLSCNITDHGNVSLLLHDGNGNHDEIWSIV